MNFIYTGFIELLKIKPLSIFSSSHNKPIYTVKNKINGTNPMFILVSSNNNMYIEIGGTMTSKNNGMILKIREILKIDKLDNTTTITVRFTTSNGYCINNELNIDDLLF